MHRFDLPNPEVVFQPPPPPRDQFDEFLYKSQNMATYQQLQQQQQQPPMHMVCPPEVNIELPSDSDSSRRQSKASWAGGQSISNASSYSNIATEQVNV
jgi:hypothetical protein